MPSKNYDLKLLKGIRKKLGNVLKVDAYDTLMANMLECVQVNIDKHRYAGTHWLPFPVSYL